MNSIRALILEDDLETLQVILGVLREIEKEKNIEFELTIIPDYLQTDAYINNNPQIKFDILLLDRDCYLAGSFHVVNLDNFDLNKVISISSVPTYNREARAKGVKRSVLKDYARLDEFGEKLKQELLQDIK